MKFQKKKKKKKKKWSQTKLAFFKKNKKKKKKNRVSYLKSLESNLLVRLYNAVACNDGSETKNKVHFLPFIFV